MDAARPTATRRPAERGDPSLQRQPHLMLRLAENALLVAESLRDNYFRNTASFVTVLRRALEQEQNGLRAERLLSLGGVAHPGWAHHQGEVGPFIHGGVGRP